jgi:hypothetical protein
MRAMWQRHFIKRWKKIEDGYADYRFRLFAAQLSILGSVTMRAHRRLWFIAAILLASNLAPTERLEARGWCNADKLGSSKFQNAVRAGSSLFFRSMSLVWSSFKAVELGSYEEAASYAASSVENLTNAGSSFTAAVKLVDDAVNTSLKGVDIDRAIAISEVSPEYFARAGVYR